MGCLQKLIARKIYVQVACDQERMIPGTNFGRDRPTYTRKDVVNRNCTITKCFICKNHFVTFGLFGMYHGWFMHSIANGASNTFGEPMGLRIPLHSLWG